MSKIKDVGLDQYDTEHFAQQQLGTAGIEGVESLRVMMSKLYYRHGNLFQIWLPAVLSDLDSRL